MPIQAPEGLKRLSDSDFADAAYRGMEVVFEVHTGLGRLFDEAIYHTEIASRLGARSQVMFEVSYGTFRKPYYLDLLYAGGVIFELKAVETLVGRHRAQLLNYLLCLDLPHGKLVNLRTESVQHEFVNAPLPRAERQNFAVLDGEYRAIETDVMDFRDLLVSILRDWGTCLETSLYEEAVTHFFGGESAVVRSVEIICNGHRIGNQIFRLLAPQTAFKFTGFENQQPQYEAALRNMLKHTSLSHLQWVNVGRKNITFKTISK